MTSPVKEPCSPPDPSLQALTVKERDGMSTGLGPGLPRWPAAQVSAGLRGTPRQAPNLLC